MARDLPVTAEITIPAAELAWSFARSSGPGGQNVNKVSSKAILRWKPAESAVISFAWRRRFTERFRNRINDRGEVVIDCGTSRDQSANIAECLDRLRGWLLATQHAPLARRPTKPSRGSVENRLATKRRRQTTKQQRRRKIDDE
jgi:ribosome-associated protein